MATNKCITGDAALAVFQSAVINTSKVETDIRHEEQLVVEPIAQDFKPDFSVYRIAQRPTTVSTEKAFQWAASNIIIDPLANLNDVYNMSLTAMLSEQ